MSSHVVILPACLDLSSSETLKEHFLVALESADEVHVDGSAVEQILTPGLQVLLSFFKTAKKMDKKYFFVGCSGMFREHMQMFGLQNELRMGKTS